MEGKPEGAYYSPAYIVDVLNAVFSIKKFKQVDPDPDLRPSFVPSQREQAARRPTKQQLVDK